MDVTFDIPFEGKVADAEELDKELKAMMPELVAGVSINAKGLVVNAKHEPNVIEGIQLRALVESHDPTKIPPKPPPKMLEERLQDIERRLAALESKPLEQ